MLVDRGKQTLLSTFQRVPDSIAGCWRTGHIVVAPCKISRSLDVTGKIDYIEVSQGVETVLIAQYLRLTAEVWITARSALSRITRHVAKGRMIGYTLGDTTVESRCDNGQGSALTAALHSNILAIPLGKRSQEIDTTNQAYIDMLHIINVLVLQTIGQITAITVVESTTDLAKSL